MHAGDSIPIVSGMQTPPDDVGQYCVKQFCRAVSFATAYGVAMFRHMNTHAFVVQARSQAFNCEQLYSPAKSSLARSNVRFSVMSGGVAEASVPL